VEGFGAQRLDGRGNGIGSGAGREAKETSAVDKPWRCITVTSREYGK